MYEKSGNYLSDFFLYYYATCENDEPEAELLLSDEVTVNTEEQARVPSVSLFPLDDSLV